MRANKENVLEVLNSGVSTSELSRKTGIAVMTLSDLRNRKDDSKIDKMQFRTASKLQKYYEEEIKMKSILRKVLEVNREALEQDGTWEYLNKKLNELSISEFKEELDEVDNEKVKKEITKVTLVLEIADLELQIANAPENAIDYILEEKEYFKQHGIYDELITAVLDFDKERIYEVLQGVKEDFSTRVEYLSYYLDFGDITEKLLRQVIEELKEFENNVD